MLQTIHKLYINYTLKRSKPYTKLCTKNSTFCFLNTNHAKGASVLLVVATRVATLCKCAVSYGDASRFTSKIFHTQGGFSVLTLLAFGDEKYYICTEIWEEPRLLPFFVTFPLKSGILGAHPVKICLPLVFLCLPQILIRGRLRKTTRREGKIGRRKVFR